MKMFLNVRIAESKKRKSNFFCKKNKNEWIEQPLNGTWRGYELAK